MTNLSYRTRGNSSPQGKERVYFTCHPADFQAFFEPICEDILRTQNCAIWYRAEMEQNTGKSGSNPDVPEEGTVSREQITGKAASSAGSGDFESRKGIWGWIKGRLKKNSKRDETAGMSEVKSGSTESSGKIEIRSGKTESSGESEIESSMVESAGKTAIRSERTENGRRTSTESGLPDSEEDLALDLGQMQLFVIPVTSRFLSQPNRAREVEFKFAVEHHIPILPLMQESGLESKFNRICGDLQFLDKQASAKDLTALPYEEKLKKFLDSVLLGDDLAAKVRAAFDAYIFLSYRKKDRKYAQELMRLIHKNPFCRDIAIWYDEFLTPGENFNDAIRDAMEKSSLFAMVVTPNLVNEVNYVMTTEYPKAAEAGMPVLPAQMAETDIEALQNSYPGISDGDVTDARDDVALREALSAMLQETLTEAQLARIRKTAMADEEAADDPQHLFFIGLAYLGGIDVEVNTERAADLITRAADAGLEEAIEKLVSMHRSGDGVRRNYEAAIRWQERLAGLACERYERDRTEDSGQKYFSVLWNLGDYAWEMRKAERSREIYSEMEELSTELEERFHSTGSRRDLSVSYNKLGEICEAEGELGKAREYYEMCLRITEKLSEETGTVKSRCDLSISYGRLGDICRAEGELGKAREYYEQGLRIKEELSSETGTVESRRGLSISYESLGRICEAEGKLGKAREYYEQCQQIREELIKETRTAESRRDVSVSYEDLGKICEAEGELDRAREYYEQGLRIAEELTKETGTVENRRGLSISYENLGRICEAEGELDKAREYYELDLRIAEELTKETGTVESRRDLSISYENLGRICEAEGELCKAREYYEQGLRIAEKLTKETGTVESRRDLGIFYEKLGGICEAEGEPRKAREYCEKGIRLNEELIKVTETVKSRRSLSVFYGQFGRICEAEGNLSRAREYYEMVLRIHQKLGKEIGTVESRRDLSISYANLGRICEMEGDLRKAREYFERGMRLSIELEEATGTVESRRDLSYSYSRMGRICEAEGNLSKAREYYISGLRLCEELAKEIRTVSAYDDLAYSYYFLGSLGESNTDREMLRQALAVWEQLELQCSGVKRFAENADMVRELLAGYE